MSNTNIIINIEDSVSSFINNNKTNYPHLEKLFSAICFGIAHGEKGFLLDKINENKFCMKKSDKDSFEDKQITLLVMFERVGIINEGKNYIAVNVEFIQLKNLNKNTTMQSVYSKNNE